MTLATAAKINANERKVLKVLVDYAGDFGCFPFRPLMQRTRLTRAEVRRACRSLKKKGLAEFARGLCNDDGDFVGAGYGATRLGAEQILGDA